MRNECGRVAGSKLTAALAGLALALIAGGAAADTKDAPVVRGDLGQRLDGIARAAAGEGFQGVVLVAKDRSEVLMQGYGKAVDQPASPFEPGSVVPIGSCVKDFTKVAVYQWIEAGKLKLTDTIGTFFSQAPADKRDITVQQLMDHSSGLPLGVGGGDRALLTRDEFLKHVFAARLEFAPGTSERYSNAGFSVLAAIVEQLAGEPFDAYVQKRVLDPAGLRETGFLTPKFDPARLAHAYADGEDRGTMFDIPHLADGHGWAMRGNGGYLSTVRDMLLFYRAVRAAGAGGLLRDPEHRDAVVSGRGPTVLAGSDLVSFFLFASYPGAGVEILMASNRAEWKAQQLLQRFEPALGLGGPGEASGPVLPALPDSGPGRTVKAYLDAFNSGDPAMMRRFFAEHAENGPKAMPIEKRLETYQRLHGDLGTLQVLGVRVAPEGFEVEAAGDHGQAVTLGFAVAQQAPFTLGGIRVDLGRPMRRAGAPSDAPPAVAIALPDTGPGRTIAGYIAAFNTGDEVVMRTFLERHAVPPPQGPPIEQRLQNFRGLWRELGRLTPVAVRDTPEGLRVTVHGERGEHADITFGVEKADPYRLEGLGVEVG